MTTLLSRERPALVTDIIERTENDLFILSPSGRTPRRRVLYVNSYGGRETWLRVKHEGLPSHHLWGCLELVRLGYEVALADPLAHFDYRRPFPHDLRLLRMLRGWLRRDDIVYCGHTLLYWIPLLKTLGAIKCPIVSLTYAREHLDFARAHAGIIALTPAAADEARRLAPRAKIAKLAWGAALDAFPKLPYSPQTFLACGQTCRDHVTLSRAAFLSPHPLRVISARLPAGLPWPRHATLITGGKRDDNVSYQQLFHDHYAHCSAVLIVLQNDPHEKTAVGCTNLLEAMAMARPVIVTRTGALPTEIDVEQSGCGLHVPPDDPAALARALHTLAADPTRARQMGETGRALAESYYNMHRYASELDQFFATF